MAKSVHLLFGVIIILIGSSLTGNFINCDDTSEKVGPLIEEIKGNVDLAIGTENSDQTDEKARLRRNILLSTNNLSGQTSTEGLLSSCQLTNLLLYQLINQKLGVSSGLVPGLPISPLQLLPQPQSPFPQIPGLGPGVGDLGQNSFNAPILQTYLSTSTVLNEMTTTSTHTITLMFGNKESTAVITTTKAFNVTSTQVFTLTSTVQIQPTPTVGEIQPIATNPPTNANLDYEDDYGAGRYGKDRRHSNFMSTPVLEVEVPVEKEKSSRFSKRRKNKSKEVEAEDKHYYQKDYVTGQHFYIRRPKRRGEDEGADNYESFSTEVEEYVNANPTENEYLLEPSHDASFQSQENAAAAADANNQCPKPSEITHTITKTVTKFVNSHSSIRFNTGDFSIYDSTNNNQVRRSNPVLPENGNHNKQHRVLPFRPKPRAPAEEAYQEPNNEIYTPSSSRRFRNSNSEATTQKPRSPRRFGNQRANFGPTESPVSGTSDSRSAKESVRPSSQFIRRRGSTSPTTTTTEEPSGYYDNFISSGSRRSLSRYRASTTTTTERSITRSSGRFKNSRSFRNPSYYDYENESTTTTKSPARFKSRRRYGEAADYDNPAAVPVDSSTTDGSAAVGEYASTERKYIRLKNRFTQESYK